MSKYTVPPAALQQHIAILGKTRSGKSSVMRGLVEDLLEKELPVCIVDPKGDWWGIKLAKDGKHPGYPVVIFGGEHADVPIDARAGAYVAELFATDNRPCLIDLGGWMVGERTRFYIDFASTLFKLTKGMRWLVVDEIHNFAPKGKVMDPDAGKALHWTNRLASEGLGKGLPMIFASQRPQKVHNDVLTSAETLIAMRVLHPSDRGAISDWIKGCGDLATGERVLASLAQMDRGEGWIWSPEIGLGPERVKFPMFRTYDSFRPQSAADAAGLKGWASVDLDEVKAKLATVVKEAEANDPKLLRAQIASLNSELAKLRKLPVSAKPAEIDQEALEKVRLSLLYTGRAQAFETIAKYLKSYRERVVELLSSIDAINTDTLAAQMKGTPAWTPSMAPKPVPRPPAPLISEHYEKASRKSVPASGDSKLPTGERAVLTACAQHAGEGCSREQLTVLTGYKRSSRDSYIQRLREKGLIEIDSNRIMATDAGVAALGQDFVALPIGYALREYWYGRLPEGERKILGIVCEYHPDEVTRDELSSRTGYKRSSRDSYIQRLKSRELVISTSGGVQASEMLFD